MKPKSNVQKELRRIQKYLSAQKRKYGDRILNIDEIDPKAILSKYKTKSVQLKHLKELTAQALQEQLKILDEETGEVVSLREQQRRNRSDVQIQNRKSAQQFWGGDTEEYYPLKEEIEFNNMGEDLANMIGESWNYQEFSLGNYKLLQDILDEQLAMKRKFGDAYKVAGRERAALVQNWLNKLVEEQGLGKVAQMINRYAGENPLNRQEIFYKEGSNTEFMYRAMNYLDVDDDTRRELYKTIDGV